MPLPVKNALNNTFLSNASDERDILPWPDRLIHHLIPNYQLPLHLLIHHIPYHHPVPVHQLSRDLRRQPTLPDRDPLPHRAYEGDELVLHGDLPEVLTNQPMPLLNEERLTRSDPNRHLRCPHIPRIVRNEGLNQLLRHKAKYEGVPRIRAIRLLAVRVHVDAKGISYPLHIYLLIEAIIALIIRDNPPPPNPALHLVAPRGGICIPLCLRVILNMPYNLLNHLSAFLRRAVSHPQYFTALLRLPHIINNLEIVLPDHVEGQAGLIRDISSLPNVIGPLVAVIIVRLCKLQILHHPPSSHCFPFRARLKPLPCLLNNIHLPQRG